MKLHTRMAQGFLFALWVTAWFVNPAFVKADEVESKCLDLLKQSTILEVLQEAAEERWQSLNVVKPSFMSIKKEQEAAITWAGVAPPPLMSSFLPEGVSLISHPLVDPKEQGLVKVGDGDFMSLRLHFSHDGQTLDTNIGLPVTALLDNVEMAETKGSVEDDSSDNDGDKDRTSGPTLTELLIQAKNNLGDSNNNAEARPKYLAGPKAKAVVLFFHGGGTSTTGHHVAIQLMGYLAAHGVVVISWDQDWHGEGNRDFRTADEYFKLVQAFAEKYVAPGVPVYTTGHSMGGLYTDMMLRRAGEDKLNLQQRIRGFLSLSGVPDASPDSDYEQRVKAFSQIVKNDDVKSQVHDEDNELGEMLLRQGKYSPLALLGERNMERSSVWSEADVAANLPTSLHVWGRNDWLYVGSEENIDKHVGQLPNGKLVIMGPRVDFKGQINDVGHLIFDHHRPKPIHLEAIDILEAFARMNGYSLPDIEVTVDEVEKVRDLLIKEKELVEIKIAGLEAARDKAANRRAKQAREKELPPLVAALEQVDTLAVRLKGVRQLFLQELLEKSVSDDLLRDPQGDSIATFFIYAYKRKPSFRVFVDSYMRDNLGLADKKAQQEFFLTLKSDIPETFSYILETIERDLGEVLSKTSEPYDATLVKVMQNMANNLAFREFVERFNYGLLNGSEALLGVNAEYKALESYIKALSSKKGDIVEPLVINGVATPISLEDAKVRKDRLGSRRSRIYDPGKDDPDGHKILVDRDVAQAQRVAYEKALKEVRQLQQNVVRQRDNIDRQIGSLLGQVKSERINGLREWQEALIKKLAGLDEDIVAAIDEHLVRVERGQVVVENVPHKIHDLFKEFDRLNREYKRTELELVEAERKEALSGGLGNEVKELYQSLYSTSREGSHMGLSMPEISRPEGKQLEKNGKKNWEKAEVSKIVKAVSEHILGKGVEHQLEYLKWAILQLEIREESLARLYWVKQKQYVERVVPDLYSSEEVVAAEFLALPYQRELSTAYIRVFSQVLKKWKSIWKDRPPADSVELY
ncbi:MAG: alpha/beta fold hydrolase [Pseudobdellovibrionaceae bacterium]|nr:alpha/beta fold hydrolase [Bdellovibrionales bacterium]USN47689.1 MAG: alpha/beta fold hydrolase [Pseudobdellovibrionaceae bacterium]